MIGTDILGAEDFGGAYGRTIAEVEGAAAILGAGFHDQEADDLAMLSLRFGKGGMGQVQSVGYRNGAVSFAMDPVCKGGIIRIYMEVEGSFEPNWMHQAVKREWAAFRNTITDGKPVPVTGAYGRGIIAIIKAAYSCDKSHREESIAHG